METIQTPQQQQIGGLLPNISNEMDFQWESLLSDPDILNQGFSGSSDANNTTNDNSGFLLDILKLPPVDTSASANAAATTTATTATATAQGNSGLSTSSPAFQLNLDQHTSQSSAQLPLTRQLAPAAEVSVSGANPHSGSLTTQTGIYSLNISGAPYPSPVTPNVATSPQRESELTSVPEASQTETFRLSDNMASLHVSSDSSLFGHGGHSAYGGVGEHDESAESYAASPEHAYQGMANYTNEEPIGKGKFASVWKATNITTNEAVAIKKIDLQKMGNDAAAIADCRSEAPLLQMVNHENIIKCFDYFEEGGALFLVLELAEEGDMQGLISAHREARELISEHLIWKYFVQLCDAVAYLHSNNIIHRDIKPANVFISRNDHIKLGDLGVGKHLAPGQLVEYNIVGTPYYTAPEVFNGKGYTTFSEIWSMGCVLYELITLRKPFEVEGASGIGISERTFHELKAKISSGIYRPLNTLSSEQASFVVGRCLRVVPHQRPGAVALHDVASRVLREFDLMQLNNFRQPGQTNGFGNPGPMPHAFDLGHHAHRAPRRRSRDLPQPYTDPNVLRQARGLGVQAHTQAQANSLRRTSSGQSDLRRLPQRPASVHGMAPAAAPVQQRAGHIRRSLSLPTSAAEHQQQQLYAAPGPAPRAAPMGSAAADMSKPRAVPRVRSHSTQQLSGHTFAAPQLQRPMGGSARGPAQPHGGAHYAAQPKATAAAHNPGMASQRQRGGPSGSAKPTLTSVLGPKQPSQGMRRQQQQPSTVGGQAGAAPQKHGYFSFDTSQPEQSA